MRSILVPLAWQILAIWQRILLPTYFATGNHLCHPLLLSILPACMKFGGRDQCNTHQTPDWPSSAHYHDCSCWYVWRCSGISWSSWSEFWALHCISQLNGPAADATLWMLSPGLAGIVTSVCFMLIRGAAFYGGDVLHQTLWVCSRFHRYMTFF